MQIKIQIEERQSNTYSKNNSLININKMKNSAIFVLLLLLSGSLLGQYNNSEIPTSINPSGDEPDASAILDVQSTDKGILIPRMTTAQRIAISSPAQGLLVFDLGTGGFWFYNGQAWADLSTGGDVSWGDLSDIPSDIADGDDVNDADSDATNELQNWSNLPGIPTEILDGDDNTQLSEAQVNAIVANNGYIQNEADGDPTNEIELPSG